MPVAAGLKSTISIYSEYHMWSFFSKREMRSTYVYNVHHILATKTQLFLTVIWYDQNIDLNISKSKFFKSRKNDLINCLILGIFRMLVNKYSFFFQLFNILLTFSTMAHFTNFISNASRADSSLLMLESAIHVSDTHKKNFLLFIKVMHWITHMQFVYIWYENENMLVKKRRECSVQT